MNGYDTLAHNIAQAVITLFQNDAYLLEMNAHEIAINHRIAIYLERCFQLENLESNQIILSVDLEFNRVAVQAPTVEKGTRTMVTFEVCDPDGNLVLEDREVRPDIVVHERGSNQHNILWIEIKCGSDEEIYRDDREKVFHACTQLGFDVGAALLIDYPRKLLTIYMVTQMGVSIEYRFDVSRRETMIIYRNMRYNDRPDPRKFSKLLR